ncbi:DUF2637 domain-containing protein [Leucobacter sp. cx-169]|uniref:DUF2637 domain-containing protein n=1 Tax=Leucobacter sp. cx-169 TaxID=2770549 RepID=UPI00165DE021|nr:DUF2637 domain-containing protein [Leucobacter sp. cx-169]MBC9927340.1 DUF2637 domain-containing protein [Leucobacter sp. cx-169]
MNVTEKKKSSARISPDRQAVGWFAIALVVTIMVASYVFSYATIAEAAKWAGPPEGAEWVQFLAPIFIDGAILTYTVSFAIYRWRGELENSGIARRWLWTFTIISVLINGAHAGSHWSWDFTRYEAFFGVLIAISAPLAALVSAEEVVRLSFQREVAAAREEAISEVSTFVPEPTYERAADAYEPDLDAAWAEHLSREAEIDPEEVAEEAPFDSEPLPALTVSEDGLFTVPPLTRQPVVVPSSPVMVGVPPVTAEVPVQYLVAS